MTTLKKQLFGVVATTVAFGAGFGFTAMALDDGVVDSTFETPAQSSGPAVPNKVAALIAKHDCWTGQAPADMEGVVPGHVVVTKHGATAPTYGGSRLVGLALDQVFNGADHSLTVHGFCR
ncbi:hypothetical protein [Nocardioides jensenii]|uniref:hypothetical protein n=1 Tax=Nocardioides jensenii TaxID=1843 RepID=UPI000832DA2A|nr:hypothetical protein [Nocardioides jensenii]